MILIFNTIIERKARENFTDVIAERITFSSPYEVIILENDIPDLSRYSHLLISGSELSASAESKWDSKIISVIRSFLDDGKAILGICHGHQMLARAIAGYNVCRKASEPEFGWRKMQINPNPLFKGISDPVFLSSRYDEVYHLPDDVKIIAWNENAEIQAFQYKEQPVWGVQFHPEMLYEDGTKMIDRHLDENVQEKLYYQVQLQNISQIEQNFLIFENFLRS